MKRLKAQFVYENLDFERGQDPKDALGIGNHMEKAKRQLRKAMKEITSEYGGNYRISRGHRGIMPEIRAIWNPEDDKEHSYAIHYSSPYLGGVGKKPKYSFDIGKRIRNGKWLIAPIERFEDINDAKDAMMELYIIR